MLFELKINLTDEDYFEFNKFWTLRSHYGKSQMLKFRLMIAAMFALAILVFGMGDGLSSFTLVYAVPVLIALVLFQLLFNKIMESSLKSHIKSLKKKGKMGYSPESTMQFGESTLTEITPTVRAEQAYSAIERISIVGDGAIYLHINNVGAYIVPASAFDSAQSRAAFIEFIKTKCQNLDLY